MMTKAFSANAARALAQVAALCTVASFGGCGGGDGGDGPVASVLPPPAKAAPVRVGSTTSSALGLGGLYTTLTSDGTSYKVSDRSAAGGNAATLTDPDPVTGERKFTVAGKLAGGTTVPNTSGMYQVPSTGFYTLQGTTATGGQGTLIEITNASRQDSTILLNASGYGMYAASEVVPAGQSATFGYVFGGNPTDPATIQKNVVATYAGALAGLEIEASGTPTTAKPLFSKAITGDVALKFDTGAGTVKGNVYNITAYDSGTPGGTGAGYGLAIDAKVDAATGNTYQGSVNFTNASTTSGAAAVVGATQSNVVGGLYGPGAAETAGALQVQGKAPGAGLPSDLVVMGAYGAKKQ